MEAHLLSNWEPSRSLKVKLKKAEILKRKLADYEFFKKTLEDKRKAELHKRNRLKQIVHHHKKLEERLESAAIVIQRFVRGYLTRKKTAYVQLYLEKRRLEVYLNELHTQVQYCYLHIGEVVDKAAIKIQSNVRRYMVRMKYVHDISKRRKDVIQGKNLAAVMIQKNVRKFVARCRYLRRLEEIRNQKLRAIEDRLRFIRVKGWWSVNKYRIGVVKRHYDGIHAAERKTEASVRSRKSSIISSSSPKNYSSVVLSKFSYFRSRSIGQSSVLSHRSKPESSKVDLSLVSSDTKSKLSSSSIPRTPQETSRPNDLPTVLSINLSPSTESPKNFFKSPTEPPQLTVNKVSCNLSSNISTRRSSTQIKPRPPSSDPPSYLRPTLNLIHRWQVDQDKLPKKKLRKLNSKPSYLRNTASSELRIKTVETDRKRVISSESRILNSYRTPNMLGYEPHTRLFTGLTSASISKPKMPTFIEDYPIKSSHDMGKPLSVLRAEYREDVIVSPKNTKSIKLLPIQDDTYYTYKENISNIVYTKANTEHIKHYPEEETDSNLLPLNENSLDLTELRYHPPKLSSQKFESALPDMFYFVDRYGPNTNKPVKDFQLHTERPSTSGESSLSSYLMINRYKL